MNTEFTDITEMKRDSRRDSLAGSPRTSGAAGGGWLPLFALPSVAIIFRHHFADWVFMWVLASSIFFGCKWLTWSRRRKASISRLRSLAYLFLWPGMDEGFLHRSAQKPFPGEWLAALAKTAAGLVMVAWASAQVRRSPWLAVWVGMAGLASLLHFGVFSLMSCAYRAAGIDARPLMENPIAATSLSEFWSRRWNAAFTKLGHDFILLPLSRRLGGFCAALSVFVVSGFVHDLVISLPAHGGYGLPTSYFLLQGTAVMFERSRTGEMLGLGKGSIGRIFMIGVTTVPLPWLFHACFVGHVMLPMLSAIGGLWRTS